MGTIKPVSIPTKTLAQNLSSSGTTLYLNNTLGWDSAQLSSADFGTQAFATLRNSSNTQIEFIEIDPSTVTSASAITILKRGLGYDGAQVADAETKYNWNAFDTYVEIGADIPQLLAQLVEEAGAETIAGVKTFSSIPKTTGGNPSDDNELTRKAYVLSVINGGAVANNRVVVAGNAGETVSAGNLLYLDVADGEWKKCDADTAALVDNIIIGIAQGAGTDGVAITSGVLLFGLDENQSGLTTNTKYYAGNTAGAISSSAGTTEVSVGISRSTTSILFWPRFDQQITEAIQDALTPGGNYGTPSSSNPYLTKDVVSTTTIPVPVVRVYTANSAVGDSTTQIDITNPSGTTFRYTYDTTGTDPSFSAVNYPAGTVVDFQAQNFTAANNGLFVVTGSGANYIEVTNASGVVESNKTIGTGYINKGATWTKPSGLKYITIRQVGAGAAGDGTTSSDTACAGGSSAGYAEKLIATAALASTVSLSVGIGATGTTTNSTQVGGRTIFNHSSPIITTGGTGQGTPGTATGGDINMTGQEGGGQYTNSTTGNLGGKGADTILGLGGMSTDADESGRAATGYGAGGGGGNAAGAADVSGGNGASGVIILTEHYI